MRFSWFFIVCLLVFGSVAAEQMDAYVDQPTTVITACIRNSQLRDSATATIEVFNENGSIVVPKTSMVSAGNGTFSFTYTFTDIGGFSTREICDFGGLLADGSTMINVMKPSFGSMQVIAQGVSQVDIGKDAVSEWLLLLPNSTNTTTSSLRVLGGSCGVSDINGSATNASILVTVADDKMTALFNADPVAGFVEGSSYQVLCNINLSQGMHVNGVKNYVYINPHVSFIQYLLQLIGLAQTTSENVNQTLSISNQTLQIVSALNITGNPTMIYEQIPMLKSGSVSAWEGVPMVSTAKLVVGSTNIVDAVCTVQIENGGVVVLTVNATYDEGTELYSYNWTPSGVGSYLTRWDCTGGGNLTTRVVYEVASINVNGGVQMQVLS